MAFPTLAVSVAFSTLPGAVTPTWTDVTSYVRAIKIKRGRAYESEEFSAGSCSVLLSNADRRFDPTYTSGPYYSGGATYVLPMREVKVVATYSAVDYPLFRGFADGWLMEWPGMVDATTKLTTTDGFKVLSRNKITESYAAQATGARLAAILDDISWHASLRDIDTGNTSLQAADYAKNTALEAITHAVQSEFGSFFFDASGRLRFIERRAIYTDSVYNTSQATFGDAVGELPYTDIKISYDDEQIVNDVSVTAFDGDEQTATDATSTGAYLIHSKDLPELLIASDNEALSGAEYLVFRGKDPKVRIERLDVMPQDAVALWPVVLGHELRTRWTVKRRPQNIGSAISQEVHLEGITHDIDLQDRIWNCSFNLSLADSNQYWILGDATYGVLNSTTRLGF